MNKLKSLGSRVAFLSLIVACVVPMAAFAEKPEKILMHDVVRQISGGGTEIFIGINHVSATVKGGGVWNGNDLFRVTGVNMSQNLRLFEWNSETAKKGDLMAVVEIRAELSGEVTEGFFEGGGPPDFDGNVVSGHAVVQWHVKDFTGGVLQFNGDSDGSWNYWFGDGEIVRSKGRGVFPTFP